MVTERERDYAALFAALDGDIQIDGNMWCASIGENGPLLCTGFGGTRMKAMLECIHNYIYEKPYMSGDEDILKSN